MDQFSVRDPVCGVSSVVACYARPTATGVDGGVDVDVTVTLASGEMVEGEVTLVRSLFCRHVFVSWGQPDNWVDDRLLSRLRALDTDDYRDALALIEAVASDEVVS